MAGVASAETRVDWEKGTIAASAVGVADLRAPSTGIARVAAERNARRQAAAELEKAVRALPLAPGAKLGDSVHDLVEATAPQLERQSDGSVTARLVVPLVTLSAVAAGLPLPGPGADAVIIDARSLDVQPALGYRVKGGGVVAAFVREGKSVTRATAVKGLEIAIEGPPPPGPVVLLVKSAAKP
jgi:hypothetical protein